MVLRVVAVLNHDDSVRWVMFSPDGTRLATASTAHTARVWDPTTGQQLTQLTHSRTVWVVVFSPDAADPQ
jgi:WD40 repeat protein